MIKKKFYLSKKYQHFQESNTIVIEEKIFLSIDKNFAAINTGNTSCDENKIF